jgi:hypothetical protein
VKEFIKLREAAVVGDTDVLYKSLTKDGKPIPPPEEIEPHILDALLVELQRYQEMKIQKIFGIFDASLGNRTNEQSGIAIEKRQQGGDISNYDLQFNYLQYVEQVNRVKLDLLPKYITAPQQLAFVDEDDKTVMQWVNTTGGVSFSPDEEFSLSIEAVPISPTAREEEALALSRMAEVAPMLAANPKILALIVRAQPGRYSSQIADMLAGENPEMEQAKALLGQMQQELQRLTEASRTKIAQDQITIATLRGTLTLLRQQTQLLRTINQADKAENQGEDPPSLSRSTRNRSRIRSAPTKESERTYAKADLLDSVSKFQTAEPPPGMKCWRRRTTSQRPASKMSSLSLPGR